MVENDVGYRFTNEVYATKRDVQNTLKITLAIDKIWTNIVEYRSNFTTKIGIKSIDDTYFSVCLAPNINDKLNTIERKINNIYKRYNKVTSFGLRRLVSNKNLSECVKTLAASLMINVSDEEVKNIVNNNASALSPDKIILQKYCALLRDLHDRDSLSNLDSIYDYLYDIVSNLIPSLDESDNIYRTRSIMMNKLNLSNVYEESPVRLIEPLMNELFSFLQTSNKSYLIKTIVTMFYINYIKPFDAYNELISALLAKYIVLNSDLEVVASFINIESILLKDGKLNETMIESQKTCDITYFLNYFCDKLNSRLDYIIQSIETSKLEEVANEYYDFEAAQQEARDNVSPMSVEELKQTDSTNESQEEETVEEYSEPAISIQHHESNEEEEDDDESLQYTKNAAITSLTLGLSEDEAKKVEEFVLESNPNISPSQAYFYARHCTIGKYYTISQYKKEVGCAYETARTSMDKLVSEGYYAKKGYKNKYIYTPIKRK